MQSEVLLKERFSNFYGLESMGYTQVRGNGTLELTREALIFQMYIPRKKLTIPLLDILYCDTALHHLSKLGPRLLRIKHKYGESMDTAAWAVNDPEKWISQIQSSRGMLWQSC